MESTVHLLVRGDQVRLRQALSKLMGNAIKFTERDRINVKLSLIGENGTHHMRVFRSARYRYLYFFRTANTTVLFVQPS
ncbi:hypothetical protein DX877_05830 [Xylella fastidiosa subsp. fastidiosa]|nr:hypothetical protein [Xylella fastidiosa subsp. fastidiosa]QIS26848.1 hypothetical protein F7G16_03810 [Xylella fastidiosa]RUA37432.1 hypothetical protein DX877_05830 [Xylella fastidiosa subsp. fastidiosa]RUA38068.1 hypothetical protein DX878_04830 [Xylella fastidiosa subsp. fastidiosa]TWP36459.1 hypothetical protein FNS29_07135 [Xylella fastidiosa subsp. fastidiosa]